MGDKFVGGVRIQFPGVGGIPVQKVIPIPNRPYKLPFLCGMCGETHLVKTYHLDLDTEGTKIVSREIAEELLKAGVEFTVLNVVRHPPRQQLNIGGVTAMFRIEQKEKAVPA